MTQKQRIEVTVLLAELDKLAAHIEQQPATIAERAKANATEIVERTARQLGAFEYELEASAKAIRSLARRTREHLGLKEVA